MFFIVIWNAFSHQFWNLVQNSSVFQLQKVINQRILANVILESWNPFHDGLLQRIQLIPLIRNLKVFKVNCALIFIAFLIIIILSHCRNCPVLKSFRSTHVNWLFLCENASLVSLKILVPLVFNILWSMHPLVLSKVIFFYAFGNICGSLSFFNKLLRIFQSFSGFGPHPFNAPVTLVFSCLGANVVPHLVRKL